MCRQPDRQTSRRTVGGSQDVAPRRPQTLVQFAAVTEMLCPNSLQCL